MSFASANVDDVISAISRLSDEGSAADLLPVSVMKRVTVTDEIAPFLAELLNRSMSVGHFPSTFTEAFITSVIKKLQGLMSLMFSLIVQSGIYLWCLSFLNGLSNVNSTSIYNSRIFYHLFNLAFGRTIGQKLLFFVSFLISLMHRRRSDWNSGGTHGGTSYKSPAVEAKTHFPTL